MGRLTIGFNRWPIGAPRVRYSMNGYCTSSWIPDAGVARKGTGIDRFAFYSQGCQIFQILSSFHRT